MGRKQRSLKPRSRESVNRQLDGDKDSGRLLVPRGDYSINPNLVNVRMDKLGCYRKGKTVFRIWNMLDPEDPTGNLLNGRLSSLGTAGLGGMSISEPAICCQYVGITQNHGLDKGTTANPCSYVIARSKSCSYEGVSFWDLPYPKLYLTAKRALDTGKFGDGRAWDPAWNILLRAKQPALSPFKQRYFAVCSLYENGPNLDLNRELIEYTKGNQEISNEFPRDGVPLGEKEDDPLVVLMLTVSAGKKLLHMCNIEKQDYAGDESLDPSIMFEYGDPCGKYNAKTGTVDGGVFFTVYNPQVVNIKSATSHDSGNAAKPIGGFVEYECSVSHKYKGPSGTLSPSLNADQVEQIFNKNLFLWKDSEEDPANSYLLHEPSIEERCVYLAKAFKPVPKLLEFCWMSCPEYLQFDEVAGILRNRVVVAKPEAPESEDFEEVEEEVAKPKAKLQRKAAKRSTSELLSEVEDENQPSLSQEDDEEWEEDEDSEDFDSFDDEDEEDENLEDEIEKELEDLDEDEDDDELEDLEEDEDGDEDDDDDEIKSQLEESLSKAKAVARSKKRSSRKPRG